MSVYINIRLTFIMKEGEILKDYIDRQKSPKVSVAEGLGMTRDGLYTLFKTKEFKPETKEKLEKYFGEKIFPPTPEDRADGNNEEVSDKMYQINPFLKDAPRSGSVPVKVMDVDFAGGSGVVFYDDNVEFPSYEMKIPAFSGAIGFNVFGKSMEPLIMSGSICFGRKIDNWQLFIEYGQIYGIILKDGRRMIKRIKKNIDKNKYSIISENPDFDDDEIDRALIKNIWLIEGWMLKNT